MVLHQCNPILQSKPTYAPAPARRNRARHNDYTSNNMNMRRMSVTHAVTAFCATCIMLMTITSSDAFTLQRHTLSPTINRIHGQIENNSNINEETSYRLIRMRMKMSSNFNDKEVSVNGAENIVLSSSFFKDRSSLLESAFDAMDDRDKYDAVLTGLCSKIIDGSGGKSDNNAEELVDSIASDASLTPSQLAMKKMNDPLQLLEEMNRSKVRASSRSLMALVDVSTCA